MDSITQYVKSMTDDQLSNSLRTEFGYKAGPITVSTRSVYEKKLINFKTSKGLTPTKTPAKSTSNGSHAAGES